MGVQDVEAQPHSLFDANNAVKSHDKSHHVPGSANGVIGNHRGSHGFRCLHDHAEEDKKDNTSVAAERDRLQQEDVLRRLQLASFLCLIFLVSEVFGGMLAGSLAVLSDAAHLFSDLASFVFAVAAGHLAKMPGTATFTFGFRRTEVLAALFSMVSLAVVSLFLTGEGLRRLWPYIVSWVKESGLDSMEEVDGAVMSLIALIGVVVNVALALVLGVENHVHMPGDDHGHDHGHSHAHEDCGGHDEYEGQDGMWQYHGHSHDHDHGHHDDEDPEEGDGCSDDDPDFDPLLPPQGGCDIQKGGGEVPKSKKNINLHAAYVHVLGDLAQSVAVLVAGLVIWWKPSWRVIDPILSVIFCPIIFYSTIGVIRSSLNILLEGVPSHINLDAVRSSIASVDGVSHVCDLHVWSISHGSVAMTVHARARAPQSALAQIHEVCLRRHDIGHCTIQLEQDVGNMSKDCITCGPGMTHCHSPTRLIQAVRSIELELALRSKSNKENQARAMCVPCTPSGLSSSHSSTFAEQRPR